MSHEEDKTGGVCSQLLVSNSPKNNNKQEVKNRSPGVRRSRLLEMEGKSGGMWWQEREERPK